MMDSILRNLKFMKLVFRQKKKDFQKKPFKHVCIKWSTRKP